MRLLTKQLISDLKKDGFDDQQIIEAMCDGLYLLQAGIDQDTAEEVYNYLKGN